MSSCPSSLSLIRFLPLPLFFSALSVLSSSPLSGSGINARLSSIQQQGLLSSIWGFAVFAGLVRCLRCVRCLRWFAVFATITTQAHGIKDSTMSLRKPPLPRILLNNVSCMRNAQKVLCNINVSVHDGGALVLTGANGSGKSTFMRMLAGFSRPSAGEILWDGHDITQSGVFQQYKLLLNWMSLKDAIKDKNTVLENVEWFEFLEGKSGGSKKAIELMGLGRLMNEKARMLSMGQRKRLQLARVLALDRPIWLLDEPSVALDDEGVKLLEYIISEHRKKGGIVFVATHLPIETEDAMVLRLPPRFPRRKTLVDLLD